MQGKRVNWLAYFSLYNIELEILINAFSVIYKEMRACTLKDLMIPQVFNTLNPSLVRKLVEKGVLKKFRKGGGTLYTITGRGLKAFFSTIQPIHEVIESNPGLRWDEIAYRVREKAFFGGIHRVYTTHSKLVKRILDIMSEAGLVKIVDDKYYPVPVEERIDAAANMVGKITSVAALRRIDDVIRVICTSLSIPEDKIDLILSKIVSKGIIVGDRDPRKALFELLLKLKSLAAENMKNGRVLEAAAYESMGILVIDSLEKLGFDSKELKEYRIKYLFHFYEALGDYFYQSLAFEVSKTMYHRAVIVAQESPSLAREAHRVNAKYLLSLARSLAFKGRYEEALARLAELIGYYRSTGAIRESRIAEALRKEYLAEIEVRKNKPCNAYKSWLEAAAIYDELGGDYKSKAKALRVKALISKAECLMINEKDSEEAIKYLEQASKEAEEILSPHLRNVARSLLHEARASILISQGKLEDASKEYLEAAKYYDLRGYASRYLLNLARSYKFKAYHEIVQGLYERARNDLEEAMNKYMELYKKVYAKYSSTGGVNYYLLKESIKGYYDSLGIKSVVDAYLLIKEAPLPNNYVLTRIKHLLKESMKAWIESGRETEYKVVSNVYSALARIEDVDDILELIHVTGDVAEILDDLGEIEKIESPRTRTLYKVLVDLLSNIKSSLEVITRYIEELGKK